MQLLGLVLWALTPVHDGAYPRGPGGEGQLQGLLVGEGARAELVVVEIKHNGDAGGPDGGGG